jgi:hypothetical protein
MNRSYDSVVALLSRNLHTPKALSKNNRFRFSSQRRYKQTLTKSDRGAHAIVGKNIRRTNEKSLMNGDGSYLYGLKPVDFSIPPSIHISPPPPPKKPGVKNYVFPISLVITFGTCIYFYLNNKNDAFDYWSAMQTGGSMPIFGNDDEEEEK